MVQVEAQRLDQSRQGSALQSWIRALELNKTVLGASIKTLFCLVSAMAETHGERIALLDEYTQLSYRGLIAQAVRYARWAQLQKLQVGDVVCLMMPNRADYVAIWLGLTRSGCPVALINTNLADEALLHSITAAGSSHLIVDATMLPAVMAVADRLPPRVRVWVRGDASVGPWPSLETETLSDARLDEREIALPQPADRALLIYTSGTTGLPKAANVSHRRVLEWGVWFAGMMDAQPADRLYNCLPMYHSVGGIVAIGAMLAKGGSVMIRPRFSAHRFWDDVTDHGCTIFQYIGELCRYLTASPSHPKERAHRLRLACGNGLHGDVWTNFQSRFAVPRILEFYAATEGVVSLYNCEGKPGAIGRVPAFLAHRFPVALIRCDLETLAPVRDAAGFCVACDVDEPGEAIGQVFRRGGDPARRFDGYTDEAASERKILRDVFAKGDEWFRTGDLLRRDAAGFFYFVDRMGDTFRWRGENVSTTQVADVVRSFPGVNDAVVYGVSVPGYEGRAGMAAITTDRACFDIAALAAHLEAHLPRYAQPLFVRCCVSLEMTGTFKLTKGTLVQEGYAAATDPVWFHDRRIGRFVGCDDAVVRGIADGSLRA